MHILILYRSYTNTAHDFRQHFFDEFQKHCKVTYFNTGDRANRNIPTFESILDKVCPNDKPDVVFVFTLTKGGYQKGMENFKGPIVLYECDSESYRGKIIDFLNLVKNARLLALEFYPDCEWEGYPIEHKIWCPPAITSEDRIRGLDRIYEFGHCGSYAAYRGWHSPRLDFVKRVMPTIKSFKMEIRGERLEDAGVGLQSNPLLSSNDLSVFANQVKIMFACPTKWSWVTHQYFYPLANGCLVIGPKPRGYDKIMTSECLVEVKTDFSDLEEKVKYYLENDDVRNILVKKAHDFVQQNHTVKCRVESLIKKIKEIG